MDGVKKVKTIKATKEKIVRELFFNKLDANRYDGSWMDVGQQKVYIVTDKNSLKRTEITFDEIIELVKNNMKAGVILEVQS